MPPTELVGLDVAVALHDYNPMPLTHYKASWVNWDESWPEPIWPLKLNTGKYVVRATIERELIKPFQELETKGVGVMVGEFGCHNQTPHRYVLSWINDTLTAFKKAGFGWALWNFTGSFGVCDSGGSTSRMKTGTAGSSTGPCSSCCKRDESAGCHSICSTVHPRVGDQEVGDDEAVAVGHSFLGAQQAEGFRELSQPADEKSPCAIEQCAIGSAPVVQVAEHVPQLEDGPIGDSSLREQFLDALVGRAAFTKAPMLARSGRIRTSATERMPWAASRLASSSGRRPPYPIV